MKPNLLGVDKVSNKNNEMDYPKWFDFENEEILKIDSDIKDSKNYYNYRFSMIMIIEEKLKKDLMIILMNPSKATSKKSDRTINRVINYAKDKYRRVYLYNTLPVYETDSGAVKKVIEENTNKDIIEINTDAIIAKLEKLDFNCTDLILATGNPVSTYGKEQIDKIYEKIKQKNIPIKFFTKDGNTIEVNGVESNNKRYTKHLRVISNKALDNELITGSITDLIKKDSIYQ